MLLEIVADQHGSVRLGWLTQQVLYARFERFISTQLGLHVTCEFQRLLQGRSQVWYFSDARAVEAYDLSAADSMASALMDRRDQFEAIVSLPWRGVLNARARSFASAFGRFEYVPSPEQFDGRLRAVAPQVGPQLAALNEGGTSLQRASGEPPFIYEFDLRDFESGRFAAVRHRATPDPPGSAWLCTARSDEEALVVAQRAALFEWSLPEKRQPQDFSVRFINDRIGRS